MQVNTPLLTKKLVNKAKNGRLALSKRYNKNR